MKLNYSVNNSGSLFDVVKSVGEGVFGRTGVRVLDKASMGGEDFSEYLRHIPGFYMYLGTGNGAKKINKPWHHPQFDIDEKALPFGVEFITSFAKRFLNK